MWSTINDWIGQGIDAATTWLFQIGDAVGFNLFGYLIAITILSIVLAYLVLPAVGKSDEASKGGKGKKE